ncbi:MAG: universal stress protein [Limisphaerales bacterium]
MKARNESGNGSHSKKSGSAGEHPATYAGPAQDHLCHSIKFGTFVVPIDFSDCSLFALDYAAALAHRLNAKIVLLHIVEPAVCQDNRFGVSSAAERANRKLVEAGQRRLSAVAKLKFTAGADFELLVRTGHPHSEIPDTARALGADMILLGTHGHTASQRFPMGSTAERVVRLASCPVLTVPLARAKAQVRTAAKTAGG